MGVFVGNDYREFSVYVSFGLENYVKGKCGRSDSGKLRLVSLCTYVWNCYVMKLVIINIAGNDLRELL